VNKPDKNIPVVIPDPEVAEKVREAQERVLRGEVIRRERRPRH
jgi:hypothetical protein